MFKDVISLLEKMSEKDKVSILILLTQSVGLKTPSQMAAYNKSKGLKPSTFRGVLISPLYKKLTIAGKTFVTSEFKDDNLPF